MEKLNPFRKPIYDGWRGRQIGREDLIITPEEQLHREVIFEELKSFLGKQVLVAEPYQPLIDLVHEATYVDQFERHDTMRTTFGVVSYITRAHIHEAGREREDAVKNFELLVTKLTPKLTQMLREKLK